MAIYLIKVVEVGISVVIIILFDVDMVIGYESHHSISQRANFKAKTNLLEIKGVVIFIVVYHRPVCSSLLQQLLSGAFNSGPSGPRRCGVNRCCRAATSIDRYNGIIGDLALADRALAVVGVDMEPLVEAVPAEEMAALGDDGVVSHVKADIALEVGSIPPGLVVGFIGIGCGGVRRRLVVCEGGARLWWTSWPRAPGGSGGASLPLVSVQLLRRLVARVLRGVVIVVDRTVAMLLLAVVLLLLLLVVLLLLLLVRRRLRLRRLWPSLSPPGVHVVGVGAAAVCEAAASSSSPSAAAGIGPAGHEDWSGIALKDRDLGR